MRDEELELTGNRDVSDYEIGRRAQDSQCEPR